MAVELEAEHRRHKFFGRQNTYFASRGHNAWNYLLVKSSYIFYSFLKFIPLTIKPTYLYSFLKFIPLIIKSSYIPLQHSFSTCLAT
jgi:hypothetical protein